MFWTLAIGDNPISAPICMATKTASGVCMHFGISPEDDIIFASLIVSSIPLGIIPKERFCTIGKFSSITTSLISAVDR
jgi:hypothetical protein